MFSNDDVLEILKVVQARGYDYFEYDTDEFSLVLENQADGWSANSCVKRKANITNQSDAETQTETAVQQEAEADSHLKRVMAPLPGVFYRAPKPGAPPFVEVGSKVKADSLVCIIESMKLMNSIYAGVAGTVTEICLEDGDFADKHGVLIRIDPEES